jgi:eukaryotic-like serine/threonine-protein kinase
LYVADGRGNVGVYDAGTGAAGWARPLPKPAASPAIADGILVVGAGDGLYGLDAASGTTVWKLATQAPVLSAPAIVDGTVYAGLPDGTLVALDLRSGVTRFQTIPLGGPIERAPAVAEGSVFAGADGGTFASFDSASGALRWTRALGGGQVSTPAARDGIVYVTSGLDHPEMQHVLFALDAATGNIRWTFGAPGGEALYVGAVGPDLVYGVSLDGHVYALRAGTQAWEVDGGASIGSVATLSQGALYVCASDGTILAVDATSSAILWTVAVDGGPGPAIVADRRLWVGTDLGVLAAFGAASP